MRGECGANAVLIIPPPLDGHKPWICGHTSTHFRVVSFLVPEHPVEGLPDVSPHYEPSEAGTRMKGKGRKWAPLIFGPHMGLICHEI